jgi:hypothetical protein
VTTWREEALARDRVDHQRIPREHDDLVRKAAAFDEIAGLLEAHDEDMAQLGADVVSIVNRTKETR